MTGQHEISIQKNNILQKMKIKSPEDLWVLNPSVIKQRVDEKLYRLWRRVRANYSQGRGPTWSRLIDEIGQRGSVAQYFGTKVSFGCIGRPTPQSDMMMLQRYLMGKIPILTEEGEITPQTTEDLWAFMYYKNYETHPDTKLRRLYQRMEDRTQQGNGVEKSFNFIGGYPSVRRKYGRSIKFRHVKLQSLIHSYANELEALILGNEEIEIEGRRKSVSSIPDLQFLRKKGRLTDLKVRKLANRVQRHRYETRVGYYDLVDGVGQRQAVVQHFGRPINRFDVNPDIANYDRSRVYSREVMTVSR